MGVQIVEKWVKICVNMRNNEDDGSSDDNESDEEEDG